MNKQEAIEKAKEYGEFYGNAFGGTVKMVPVGLIIDIISKIDEPQKVVVPKFVADWIDEMKNIRLVDVISCSPSEIKKWLYGEELRGEESENEKTFIRAWLDGYDIELEETDE